MKISQENILFHHTGVITDDIQLSADFFVKLGYKASKIYEDEPQQSYVILLKKTDSPIIELISPMGDNSPAQGWVKRIGCGAYHICYEIKDARLSDAIDYFKSQNFTPISKPTLSPAFSGAHVVFLWGRAGGLIELLGMF